MELALSESSHFLGKIKGRNPTTREDASCIISDRTRIPEPWPLDTGARALLSGLPNALLPRNDPGRQRQIREVTEKHMRK
jgi:hypothetical protein